MSPTALFGAGAVPLIAGIIQVFKATGLPVRLAPVAALGLGIGAGILSLWPAQSPPVPWGAAVVLGLTWGLAASGLYHGGKLAGSALRSRPSPYAPPGSGHVARPSVAEPAGDRGPAARDGSQPTAAAVVSQPPTTK